MPTITTLTAPQVAKAYGLAAWTVYSHPEDIPVPPIRIGSRVVFPAQPIAESLGVTVEELAERLGLVDQAVQGEQNTEQADRPRASTRPAFLPRSQASGSTSGGTGGASGHRAR